jgi:hypothetical protein
MSSLEATMTDILVVSCGMGLAAVFMFTALSVLFWLQNRLEDLLMKTRARPVVELLRRHREEWP